MHCKRSNCFWSTRINGVPACANKNLLTSLLRNKWKFKGFVVSDSLALENIYKQHKYKYTPIDTAVAAIKAGVNLELTHRRETTFSEQVRVYSSFVYLFLCVCVLFFFVCLFVCFFYFFFGFCFCFCFFLFFFFKTLF